MFYYASKILWFVLQPSGLLLILLLTGTGLLYTRHWRVGRWLVVASAALVLVGGLLPLAAWLILPLESRFARADVSGRSVDGIVVLGGMEDGRVAAGRGTHALNEAAERLTEAAALARRYPAARVVYTGAATTMLTRSGSAAEAMALMFGDLGIGGEGRLLLEREARSTWENALYAKALAQPKPGERWLLVTSAWHMPRAIGVFRKVGFDVEPWPVDYRTAGPQDAWRLFDAPSEGLRRFEAGLREWIGLLAYRLSGRSDELFPGPR
jgi:uncharacterized SAM-binding protein YcdF (DUF218 family)